MQKDNKDQSTAADKRRADKVIRDKKYQETLDKLVVQKEENKKKDEDKAKSDVEKAKKEIRATNITILSVLPSFKQSLEGMQEWIKKYDLEDVFLLKPAFDVVDRVRNASSNREVVTFIENSIPDAIRNDPLFATYTCLFILDLSQEGELPSSDWCLLLTGFCGSPVTQVRLVSAIFQTRNDNGEAFL